MSYIASTNIKVYPTPNRGKAEGTTIYPFDPESKYSTEAQITRIIRLLNSAHNGCKVITPFTAGGSLEFIIGGYYFKIKNTTSIFETGKTYYAHIQLKNSYNQESTDTDNTKITGKYLISLNTTSTTESNQILDETISNTMVFSGLEIVESIPSTVTNDDIYFELFSSYPTISDKSKTILNTNDIDYEYTDKNNTVANAALNKIIPNVIYVDESDSNKLHIGVTTTYDTDIKSRNLEITTTYDTDIKSRNLEITAASITETLSADSNVTIGGNSTFNVTSNSNINVAGNLTKTITGESTEIIAKTANITYNQDRLEHVENGLHELKLKKEDISISDWKNETNAGTLSYTQTGTATINYLNEKNETVKGKLTEIFDGEVVQTANATVSQTVNATLTQSILYDEIKTIGGDKNETVIMNSLESVAGSKTLSITENYNENIEGNKTETIKGTVNQNYKNIVETYTGTETKTLAQTLTEIFNGSVEDTFNKEVTQNFNDSIVENYNTKNCSRTKSYNPSFKENFEYRLKEASVTLKTPIFDNISNSLYYQSGTYKLIIGGSTYENQSSQWTCSGWDKDQDPEGDEPNYIQEGSTNFKYITKNGKTATHSGSSTFYTRNINTTYSVNEYANEGLVLTLADLKPQNPTTDNPIDINKEYSSAKYEDTIFDPDGYKYVLGDEAYNNFVKDLPTQNPSFIKINRRGLLYTNSYIQPFKIRGNWESGSTSYIDFTVFDQNGISHCREMKQDSDIRLKKNIKNYNPTNSILDLPVVEYDWKDTNQHSIGCIAQDLQKLFPELVDIKNDGYLSISENKLVYLLLLELKKMRKELDELKK